MTEIFNDSLPILQTKSTGWRSADQYFCQIRNCYNPTHLPFDFSFFYPWQMSWWPYYTSSKTEKQNVSKRSHTVLRLYLQYYQCACLWTQEMESWTLQMSVSCTNFNNNFIAWKRMRPSQSLIYISRAGSISIDL